MGFDAKIPKGTYISQLKRQQINDHVRGLIKQLNQSSKYRRKTWVEINDDACRSYTINSQIKSTS